MDLVSNTMKSNDKFIFIYKDTYGMVYECGANTYEAARDKAQKLFHEDLVAGEWDGGDKSNCIYPKPGTEAERQFNMTRIALSSRKDSPEEGKTYALIDGAGKPSIANGNTLAESEVKPSGYDEFMQDVCNDDEPDIDTMAMDMSPQQLNKIAKDIEDKVNDTLEAMTEAMNPTTPVFTGGFSKSPSAHSENRTVNAMEVSEVAKERQARHDEMLAQLGIARAPENVSITKAGYERGKTVIDLGYHNLGASRTTWDNKPRPDACVSSFVSQIDKEEREDFVVPLTELKLRDDGKLYSPETGWINVERSGLAKLLSSAKHFDRAEYDKMYNHVASQQYQSPVPYPVESDYTSQLYPSALSLFLKLDPDIRAHVFNEQMKRHGFHDQEVKMRTRLGPDGRGVFSVVSPTYTTYDADEVAQFIGNVLRDNFDPDMFRAEIKYNAKTTDFMFDATMHAPSNLTDFSAGDVFEVGYRFKANDVGGGAVKGGGIAFWNECLNMIIIDSKTSELVKVVHKGDVESKMKKMLNGMEKSKEAMNRFAIDWGILSSIDAEGMVVNGEAIETTVSESGVVERAPVAMLKALVDSGRIGKGIGRDAAVQYLLESYDNQGGGNTMQDVINAVTRMAHESMVDDCVRDGLEQQAGALVPVLAKAAQTKSVRL